MGLAGLNGGLELHDGGKKWDINVINIVKYMPVVFAVLLLYPVALVFSFNRNRPLYPSIFTFIRTSLGMRMDYGGLHLPECLDKINENMPFPIQNIVSCSLSSLQLIEYKSLA